MTGEEIFLKNITRVLECSEKISNFDGLTILGWVVTISLVIMFFLIIIYLTNLLRYRSCFP